METEDQEQNPMLVSKHNPLLSNSSSSTDDLTSFLEPIIQEDAGSGSRTKNIVGDLFFDNPDLLNDLASLKDKVSSGEIFTLCEYYTHNVHCTIKCCFTCINANIKIFLFRSLTKLFDSFIIYDSGTILISHKIFLRRLLRTNETILSQLNPIRKSFIENVLVSTAIPGPCIDGSFAARFSFTSSRAVFWYRVLHIIVRTSDCVSSAGPQKL